jgi:hypothetical protein
MKRFEFRVSRFAFRVVASDVSFSFCLSNLISYPQITQAQLPAAINELVKESIQPACEAGRQSNSPRRGRSRAWGHAS